MKNQLPKKTSNQKLDTRNFLKIGDAARILGVSIDTLRRWEKAGKITALRTPGSTRLYSLEALKEINPKLQKKESTSPFPSIQDLIKPRTQELGGDIFKEEDFTLQAEEPINIYPTVPNKHSLKKALLTLALFGATVTLALVTFFNWPFNELFKMGGGKLTEEQKMLDGYKTLFQKNPNVLQASTESAHLEINTDTVVNGSLFAENIVYNLVAGDNISITGDPQTPVVSATLVEADTLASVTARGASTPTKVTLSGGGILGSSLTFASLTSDPSSAANGDIYYNTTSNKFRCYVNGSWTNCDTDTDTVGSGDITAVGSMTSGDAFADSTADDDWLGLGSSAGRIEFDDQATDEVNILSALVGIGDSTPDALLDLDSTSTTGGDFLITNTGAGTSGTVAGITANSVTSGDILTISATALSTGSALVLTGPTSTGVTDHFVKLSSDIGSAASLLNLNPDFSGSAVTGYGIYNLATDATTNANTDYGYYGSLTLTSNADKTGIGLYSTVSSSSTTADTLVALDLATVVTGVIASGTGVRDVYGLRSQPSAGAESTADTTNVYGVYSKPDADVAAGGTVNAYGTYIANGTYDTDGTSTAYGLYIEDISGADTNIDINFTGSPIVRIGDAGVLTFTEAGGNNTLCTITDSSNVGNLACTGNITGSSSGTVGFWTRTSTTLSPATANDIVSIPTTNTTGADLAITNTGIYTGTGLVNITANSATTGTVLALSATTLSGGTLINLTGPTTSNTAFTGDYIKASTTRSRSSGTLDDTGNFLDISRTNSTTGAGAALTVSGDLVTLASNCSIAFGTCTDTSNVLSLTQSYSAATGAVLDITNSGSGNSISAGNGTDLIQISSVGDITFVDADGGASITGPAGGALTVASGASQDVTLDAAATVNIDGDTSIIFKDGGTTYATITQSGTTDLQIDAAGGDVILPAGDALTIGGTEGSNALTVTAGDAAISDGSLSVTDDDNAASFSLTNNTATTIGVGVNTAGVADISSTSLTTGNLLNLETTTALTSGRVLNVSSTSTALTSGNLARLEWLPGSATNATTADLFQINLGTNGNLVSGNLFNILDSSSSIFSVSETAMTTSLPANFTAAGDLSVAYDLSFTNPTASFIKSSAPLSIQAGESFNSSDLTLQTYNAGSITFESASSASTSTTGLIDINANSTTSSHIGLNLDYISDSGVTAAADLFAAKFNITQNDADGDLFGLTITNLATSVTIAGTDLVECLLCLDNVENQAQAVSDAIRITNSGGTAGGINTAIDIDSTTITNDIELQNAEIIHNDTDDLITLVGAGGTNNVNLIIDLDGAGAAVPSLSSSANDLITVFDSLSIGIDGATTENIASTDFAISAGNDLYVDDKFGVNGTASFDGNLWQGDAVTTTTKTTAFLFLGTTAGAPTGDPSTPAGFAAIVYDTTNNKLCVDEEAAGAAWLCATLTDIAEWMPAAGAEVGELVSITDQENPVDDPTAPFMLGKSTKAYDDKLVGVISEYAEEAETAQGYKLSPDYHAVTLVGRVPVKVNGENGSIKRGDYLTSSSTSGVAMKATKAGTVVGMALEDFPGTQGETLQGKIMIFVKATYADPNNFLASLAFDEDGSLIVPKVTSDKIQVTSSLDITGSLTVNGTSIDSSTLLAVGSLANDVADLKDTTTQLASEINTIKDQQTSIINEQLTINNEIASNSAQLAEVAGLTQQAVDQTVSLSDKVASTSANLANLSSQIEDLLAGIQGYEATPSGELEDQLTPPDIMFATDSAKLANLDVTEKISTLDLESSGTLKSLGETLLGTTNIAGDLSVDGTFSISQNSINALPTLFIQNSALATLVDFFNGLVTINKEGTLTAQKLTIPDTSTPGSNNDPTIGSAKIPAGQISITINNNQITNTSKVFITPRTKTGAQSLVVDAISPGVSFKVSMDYPYINDITFDWIIIETK